jgi:AmmeMemoRadiSam system protein A
VHTPNEPGTQALAALPDPVEIPEAARSELLAIARVAVGVASRATPSGALDEAMHRSPPIDLRASAFVTLTENDELRGCMGILDPERPVIDSVAEAAACAARTDPRFRPVSPEELGRLEVDVSVMGPLVQIRDPLSFRLGTDGIVVQLRGRRGLLLPEVAEPGGLDRVGMLDIASRKAGLPARAWQDPEARVYAFRTDRFGGPALVEPGSSEPGPP